MSTDRETTRVVRSWLDEGVTKLPDRVLDAVLAQIPATPQRRSAWSAWRSNRMNTYAKLAAAAAAVLVIAVVGYQFLPGRPGIGAPPTPSPSPKVLAQGTFVAKGFNTTLHATGSGSNVSGSMEIVPDGGGAMTVELKCEQTVDGLLWIGGDITASTASMDGQVGTRAGIVFDPATPVRAVFVFQFNDPRAANCLAFLDEMKALEEVRPGLDPITGTVLLNP